MIGYNFVFFNIKNANDFFLFINVQQNDGKIYGIEHIDFQPNGSDVYVTEGGVGEKFAKVKIYARCGHFSLVHFYGEYENN